MIDQLPPPKVHRSKLRTAAVVAGGAGLGYGGYQVGRTAVEARQALTRLAPKVEAAVEHAKGAAAHAEAVTGAVRRAGAPLGKLRKLFRLASLRKGGVIRFAAGGTVAQDRYRKAIHEHESNRAEANYTRSALAGAAIGALRPGQIPRGRTALLGGAAGLAAQGVVRAATASSKDAFGDRPLGAKRLEKVPWQAGGVAAGALAWRKLAGKAKAAKRVVGLGARISNFKFDIANAAEAAAPTFRWAGSKISSLLRSKLGGVGAMAASGLESAEKAGVGAKALGLGGGIAAADAASSALLPDKDQSRIGAAGKGLVKGGLYGGALVAAEPLITNAAKRFFSARRQMRTGMSAPLYLAFGGAQQIRGAKNRFVDPLDVAAGTVEGYSGDERVELPIRHAQVVRAALHKGRDLQRIGSRAGRLARDVVDTASGRAKTDARGRPQKREWEKSWFKNAAGTALTGAALLGHAGLMKRNPAYRAKVSGLVKRGKATANSIVPDLFPMSVREAGHIRFDMTAPEWDVRDQRGRSARVFAPASRPRVRRPKEWHEKAENQRKLLGGLAVAAGVGGLLLGHKLGATRGVKAARAASAKKGVATRRAAASENANIERMKRQGPGGQAVS